MHIPTPPLTVPTITFGLIDQWEHTRNSLGLVPALTYQLAGIGHYASHVSALHADFGLTSRGPFVAGALTLGTYADIGFAARISSRTEAPRPYIGLHLTF